MSPLVPVGTDFLQSFCVDADEELSQRPLGVGSRSPGARLCMCSLGPSPGRLVLWGVSGQQPPGWLACVQYQAALSLPAEKSSFVPLLLSVHSLAASR